MVLGQDFLHVIRFFPYQTSVLHTHFLVYHRRHIIVATETFVTQGTSVFMILSITCVYICTRLNDYTYNRLILIFTMLRTLYLTITNKMSWSVVGGVSKNKKVISGSFVSRTIAFDYVEDVEVQGIGGYRFQLGKRLVDNGTIDVRNQCNCGGQCVPQGALNVTACRHGAPAFVSYPHYLDADPYYTRSVRGMKPDPNHHRFFITLEPVSDLQSMHYVGLLQLMSTWQQQFCSYYSLYTYVEVKRSSYSPGHEKQSGVSPVL